MEENREAVDVYLLTRNQMIVTGMGDVVDISIPAVKIAMDMLGVEDQRDCLCRVVHLFHEFKPRRDS